MKYFLLVIFFTIYLKIQLASCDHIKCVLSEAKISVKTRENFEINETYRACEFHNGKLLIPNRPFSISGSGSGDDIQCVVAKNGTITYIPSEFFMVFRNLECFVMENVGLKTIETQNFLRVGKVQTVTIQKNPLQKLSSFIFQNFKALKYLNLSENFISEIEANAFYGLDNLRVLHLSDNKIEYLMETTLMTLVNLEILYLNQNRLKTLPSKLFDGNSKLTLVNLNDNQLKFLPPGLFKFQTVLTDVLIKNNPCSDTEIKVAPGNITGIYLGLFRCLNAFFMESHEQKPQPKPANPMKIQNASNESFLDTDKEFLTDTQMHETKAGQSLEAIQREEALDNMQKAYMEFQTILIFGLLLVVALLVTLVCCLCCCKKSPSSNRPVNQINGVGNELKDMKQLNGTDQVIILQMS